MIRTRRCSVQEMMESAVSGQADRKWGRTVGERLYLYSDGATGFYGVAGGSAIVCMGGLGLYL